jgi:hypothetical protein
VNAGLRRAAQEIWDGDEKLLPASSQIYTKTIMEREPIESGEMRLAYPSYARVLRFYESMIHAWYANGFLVETKVDRKWAGAITPEVEKRLREIYSSGAKGGKQGGLPTLKGYACELGVPRFVLSKHASKMGIVPTKEPPWSREELELLGKVGYLSPDAIQQRFKRRGFKRTLVAIRLMRRRRQVHKGSPYFSANAMAVLFGIDAHKVDREWLAKYPDKLKFVLKGTRKGGRQRGDTKLFHVNTIREFVYSHPEEIDLHKVDKVWFLWLVTKGKVKMIEPSKRLGKRAEAYRPGAAREHRKGTKRGPKVCRAPAAQVQQTAQKAA